jgi:glycerophosphoryl diester phosphodiesterase
MPIQWWAHRGSGKGELENTLKGFETALSAGFKAVEFDVMRSVDGVPMVHHDWVMGRCAQSVDPAMAATDSVTRFDSLRVRDLRHFAVQGEPIPTFVETVSWCLQHGVQANVELKATGPANALALGQSVLGAMAALGDADRALIKTSWVFSSFYHASLLPLRGFKLALLYEQLPDHWIVRADALGAQDIHLHWSGAEPQAIRRIHCTGRGVRVYTVNDLDRAKALQGLGVKGIFTDRMDFAGHSF